MRRKILLFITLIGLSIHGFTFIFVNDIKPAFSTPGDELIDKNLTQGASLFLLSQSSALLLLNEYELSAQGFNIPAATEQLKKAISYIEAAKLEYLKAKEIGLQYGINPLKAAMLKEFDYISARKNNAMNTEISNKVAAFMSKADIIGLHNENLNNIQNIIDTLNRLKTQMDKGIKPPLEEFWKLYTQYSEASLFGNYCTVYGHKVFLN